MLPTLFLTLGISLMLTLLLEGLFAFFIGGIRSPRGLLLTVLVNMLTNPPVVLTYTLFPSLPMKLSLEVAAVLVEGFIYKTCSEDIRRPFLYALCINAFSFLTGDLINLLLTLL